MRVRPMLLAILASAMPIATRAQPVDRSIPVASIDVEDLAWLSGTWTTQRGPMPAGGPRFTEEVWLAPEQGLMVGVGRSILGFGRASFEFMRIQAGEDGRLRFHASPGGAPATAFELVEAAAQRAVFANPQNDFPQLITYELLGEELVATIAMSDGSRAQSWRFRRER